MAQHKQAREPKFTVEMFRQWGREGGKRRAKALSPQERSELARKAVQARWAKAKRKKKAE